MEIDTRIKVTVSNKILEEIGEPRSLSGKLGTIKDIDLHKNVHLLRIDIDGEDCEVILPNTFIENLKQVNYV